MMSTHVSIASPLAESRARMNNCFSSCPNSQWINLTDLFDPAELDREDLYRRAEKTE